ncbi:tRNA U-34 5-methylaminomethyl-2-thiouridine biosynthesis protein [Rossellomorea aquimaris]|uniref:tRNA U-34 5-methylaminomethyl-2-thiouridine biosynthesis protein n=1 Tax=Rossellomorea aquimaris TaxID=189382 RepID=UPI001CFD6A6A|nr:tRNA U-34 5-methylaminomethyl-2-thiouridine biosynthesis protein [Rossellomorea aquimaris]
MRSILLLTFGAFLGWGISGFFTNGFETDYLFILILGIVVGYIIGKMKEKEDITESL